MQETIFVKTCAFHDGDIIKFNEEIRKWLPYASVYVQMTPRRLVICRGAIATVINEGDVFSLVQRHTNNGLTHDIINHTEKKSSVFVHIAGRDFLIETFVDKVVGGTENMKFMLVCLTNPELSREFDDYASLSNELNNYIWDAVDKRLMTL